MRVRIDEQRCQGHGMCALVCAEMFVLDDETGHARVAAEIVPQAIEDQVLTARASCPEQAIEID